MKRATIYTVMLALAATSVFAQVTTITNEYIQAGGGLRIGAHYAATNAVLGDLQLSGGEIQMYDGTNWLDLVDEVEILDGVIADTNLTAALSFSSANSYLTLTDTDDNHTTTLRQNAATTTLEWTDGTNSTTALSIDHGTGAVTLNGGIVGAGTEQTYYGVDAGSGATSTNYTALGYQSAYANSGADVTAIGVQAAYSNTASQVTAAGTDAAKNAGAASLGMTAVGYQAALDANSEYGTYFGYQAGKNADAGRNAGLGYQALSDASGNRNTALGSQAGLSSSGNQNTYIGSLAGYNTTGTGNVFLGYLAGYDEDHTNTFILGTATNELITGNFDTQKVTIPGKLSVEGDMFDLTVTATSVTAAVNQHVHVTADAQVVTCPASPSTGDRFYATNQDGDHTFEIEPHSGGQIWQLNAADALSADTHLSITNGAATAWYDGSYWMVEGY